MGSRPTGSLLGRNCFPRRAPIRTARLTRKIGAMDANILINAINRAIDGGAICAPPIPGHGEDENYVRAHADIGINPDVLNAYIEELKTDPDMAAIDGLFARALSGGGMSIDFSSVARLLLAQAVSANDVPGTVARFVEAMGANAADVTAVLAISGVTTSHQINLSPDVALIPMTSLPPSLQRGIALGRSSMSAFGGPRIPIPSALITKFRFSPVMYRPRKPQPQEDFAGTAQARRAQDLLEEARNLLSLADVHPVVRMFWIQPDDLLMAPVAPGWQISTTGDHFGIDREVRASVVEGLGTNYFSIEPSKRTKTLRIPLDRLARAGREEDMADQVIDLGIALESLLLHDRGDRGELAFTLSYRGAWLLGNTAASRLEIKNSLRAIYDLRSRAVHRGEIRATRENIQTIGRAIEICKALVRRVIVLRCEPIEWDEVILGAEAGEHLVEGSS